MTDLSKAVATQLANIEKRTGKTLAELTAIVKGSGLAKHGELVKMLKTDLGMGHGDANTVVHLALKSDGQSVAAGQPMNQVLDGLYTGPRQALRPIHDELLLAMQKFGDFEEAPKKTYVSYRRKKQFAMIGPATNTRVEVGLNVKGLQAGPRLLEQPAGRMCNYIVKLGEAGEVDAELTGWIKAAYDVAG
jgi:predicted transport protein